MADHIKTSDTLNDGRIKINEYFKISEDSEKTSKSALSKSEEALLKSNSTRKQLDTIVVEGDSSVEAAQARVDANSQSHTTLKARLDDEHQKVTTQLAQTMTDIGTHSIKTEIHQPIRIFERYPDTTKLNKDDVVLVYENILKLDSVFWEDGSLSGSTGLPTVTETRIRTKDFISVETGKYLVLFVSDKINAAFPNGYPIVTVLEYDTNDEFIKSSGWIANGVVVYMDENTTKVKVCLQDSESSDNVTIDHPKVQAKPVITRLY